MEGLDDGALKPMTLDEVKAVELEMLAEVDRFCRENDIRYSLAFGTLLGAIRHHGFIPWDDDIDIMLPRGDYERFLREYPRRSDRRYRIVSFRNKPNYWYGFAKIADPETLLRENASDEPTGVYIDIFPIDGMSANDRRQDFWHRVEHSIRGLAVYKFACDMEPYRDVVRKHPLRRLLARLLPGRFIHRLADSVPRRLFPFHRSRLAGCWLSFYGWRRERLPRELFEDFTDVAFETLTVRSVCRWHDYLTKVYGDYMKLPPESERRCRHLVAAFRLPPKTDGDERTLRHDPETKQDKA